MVAINMAVMCHLCQLFQCSTCQCYNRLMTNTHLILAALLKRAGPRYTSWGSRCWRHTARARHHVLLLPEQLLHRANVDLELLLPHRHRPDVGLPAYLLLWDRLPEEAAHAALLPSIVVCGHGCQGRRRRERDGRGWWQGRRRGRFMLGGVWGVTEGRQGGVRVSGHRGCFRGGDGGCGAAAPLTAAALWLIGCWWTTHNKHHMDKLSAYELYAETARYTTRYTVVHQYSIVIPVVDFF